MSIAESIGSIYHKDGEMLYVYRFQGTGKDYSYGLKMFIDISSFSHVSDMK